MLRVAQGDCSCTSVPTANQISLLNYNRKSLHAILLQARNQATWWCVIWILPLCLSLLRPGILRPDGETKNLRAWLSHSDVLQTTWLRVQGTWLPRKALFPAYHILNKSFLSGPPFSLLENERSPMSLFPFVPHAGVYPQVTQHLILMSLLRYLHGDKGIVLILFFPQDAVRVEYVRIPALMENVFFIALTRTRN